MATSSKSLDAAFLDLYDLLSHYIPPFKAVEGTVREKRDFHLIVPKPVIVPGAYGGSPKDLGMAAIIRQKSYVGFYYMPIYLEPEVRKKLSPQLLKLLKGKSCFYVTESTPELMRDVKAALDLGVKVFKKRGWI